MVDFGASVPKEVVVGSVRLAADQGKKLIAAAYTRHAALVSGIGSRGVTPVEGVAAGQERNGLGVAAGPTVAGEGRVRHRRP